MTYLQSRIDRVMEPTGNVSFEDIRKRDAEMVSIIKELQAQLSDKIGELKSKDAVIEGLRKELELAKEVIQINWKY